MRRILVPSDGSANSLRAVDYAVATARDSKNPVEITLIHVLDPIVFTSPIATLSTDPLTRERPAAVDEALRPAEEAHHRRQSRYSSTANAATIVASAAL
jgi:nucleotide-binding universal stress UspA family protein